MGDRRLVDLMEGNVGVCFPSNSTLTEGPSESKRGKVGDSPGGPLVAKEGVVSRPLGTECRASTFTASNSKVTQATKLKRIPSEPSGSKTSRLETIAESVVSAGLSQRVAKLRKSSLRVYDSRWNCFSSWCSTKRISPWLATKQQIADFLLGLFQEGS